jgi:3-dehydro-4-phosphotetronate decarboxylase
MMNEMRARDEICRVGKSLFDRGYVHATAGNISVRLADGFLITPTDACLGFLDPARLSKLDHAGNAVSGDRPSKTIRLHRSVYEQSSGAHCVLHTHSTHCVAASLSNHFVSGVLGVSELLPPITPYFVMKVGHVPIVKYARPGAPQVAESIQRLIGDATAQGLMLRAVMLPALGPVVWHHDPAQAMASLEELEETAKLWVLSDYMAAPLTSEHIEELRQAFSAEW